METAGIPIPSRKSGKGIWMLMGATVLLAAVLVVVPRHLPIGSYEDCLKEGMKGQEMAMFANVERGCKMRFGQEVSLDTDAIPISFSSSPTGSGIRKDVAAVLGPFPIVYEIKLNQVPADIRPTRGKFLLSRWPCGVSAPRDGLVEKALGYEADGENFSFMDLGPDFKCAQAEELYGVYRPWWTRWLDN